MTNCCSFHVFIRLWESVTMNLRQCVEFIFLACVCDRQITELSRVSRITLFYLQNNKSAVYIFLNNFCTAPMIMSDWSRWCSINPFCAEEESNYVSMLSVWITGAGLKRFRVLQRQLIQRKPGFVDQRHDVPSQGLHRKQKTGWLQMVTTQLAW